MITLYTANTGNGHRVSIMLEELGLAYEVVAIDFAKMEHRGSALLTVSPVGQIPALVDTDGPDGATVRLAESSAILGYLARKHDRFLPNGALELAEADRWIAVLTATQTMLTTLFFINGIGKEGQHPLIATLHDKIARYLAAVNERLSVSAWLAGESYSYVDMLGFTITNRTLGLFGIATTPYPAIQRWNAKIAGRPAVQRGIAVPA